ncbi:unnamed protein product [Arctia plantaginis]|uniref:Retrotransposon gag domain-containing protein n=1 Tax=Arctia plantaginis TaxID=874455 RepID=A0A8S0ZNK8_ARCPL|nr:unnamed protein product [Arctia plantaginis]
MQIRLRGTARDWYDDLDDYDFTWKGWKDALETAFPRSTDFIDLLESMLARKKTNSEMRYTTATILYYTTHICRHWKTTNKLKLAIRDWLPRGEEGAPLLQLQEEPTFNRRNVTLAEEKVMKQRTAKCRAVRCAIARATRRPAAGMRPALHTQK